MLAHAADSGGLAFGVDISRLMLERAARAQARPNHGFISARTNNVGTFQWCVAKAGDTPHPIRANHRQELKEMADKTQTEQGLQLPTPTSYPDDRIVAMFERRKTTRDIDPAPLPMQELSNLLWSAFGVNRKVGPFGMPGRTAGSASNSQEIDLYVALAEGTYRYDAANCRLVLVTHSDLRASALTPGQPNITATAPVQLIYVVDLHRLTHTGGFDEPGLHDPEVQKSYYYVDTGLIAQNVYLFAAAHGLAAWFHNCDRAGLAQSLELTAEQRVLFAQSVGYPSAGGSAAVTRPVDRA